MVVSSTPPPVVAAFAPSGMYKNGGQVIPNATWTKVTEWTADTGTYPGSSISSDGLDVQVGKAGAVITANIPWTTSGGGSPLSPVQCRIKVNGTVVVTGPDAGSGSSSGTQTATITQTLLATDNVTVEVYFGAFTQTSNNIVTGAGTYLRIT